MDPSTRGNREPGAAPFGCTAPALGKRLDEYVAGRLFGAELASFELHYFECGACLTELDLARSIEAGLRQTGARGGGGLLSLPLRSLARAWGRLTKLGRTNDPGPSGS